MRLFKLGAELLLFDEFDAGIGELLLVINQIFSVIVFIQSNNNFFSRNVYVGLHYMTFKLLVNLDV
jgi:hypothetical protein